MKTEAQIIESFSKGDFSALEDLYLLFSEDLCRYAFRFVDDDAPEIVHDVFTKLIEKKDRLQGVSPLKPFLYRSVHNACVNKINRDKVEGKYVDETEFLLKQVTLEDHGFDVDTSIESLVTDAIQTLPEQARKIFEMKYQEGLKTGEIAETLGIGKKTVDTHVYRGIKTLREKLKHLIPLIIGINLIQFFDAVL